MVSGVPGELATKKCVSKMSKIETFYGNPDYSICVNIADQNFLKMVLIMINSCIIAPVNCKKLIPKGKQHLFLSFAMILSLATFETVAEEASTKKTSNSGTHSGDNLAELSHKLSNPVADVWALFTEFDMNFKRGDVTGNDYKVGSGMIFQPILPFKLTDNWSMITRPYIPVSFSAPIPDGVNFDGSSKFNYMSGLGDISVPLLFKHTSKPDASKKTGAGQFQIAAGPTFTFPTATSGELGSDAFEAGVAGLLLWKNKKITMGTLSQYWWSVAKSTHAQDTSHASFLYFFWYNLPNKWQIGTGPTVTYNDKAASGSKWNVPIGLMASKMVKIGKVPVKFMLGVEYSVAREDNFGQEWQLKLNIIPVIPNLIKGNLF